MRTSMIMVPAADALPGRTVPIVVTRPHLTLGTSMVAPFPDGLEIASFAMGCFWGAERKFYERAGVYVTSVGYQGGYTPNPNYQEVCTGRTGHAEVVQVVFDPTVVTYLDLLSTFFEGHDPTQGFRQGGDVGTQYRSAIYTNSDEQLRAATSARDLFGDRLGLAGYGPVTTELAPASPYYLAEEYHQQYLAANPNGYCGLGGTGVSCPVGLISN